MCVVMQTLEIIGGKIWSLLMSRAAEIKRKSKEGDRGRKQSIYFKQDMDKKWDTRIQERDVGSLDFGHNNRTGGVWWTLDTTSII